VYHLERFKAIGGVKKPFRLLAIKTGWINKKEKSGDDLFKKVFYMFYGWGEKGPKTESS